MSEQKFNGFPIDEFKTFKETFLKENRAVIEMWVAIMKAERNILTVTTPNTTEGERTPPEGDPI